MVNIFFELYQSNIHFSGNPALVGLVFTKATIGRTEPEMSKIAAFIQVLVTNSKA